MKHNASRRKTIRLTPDARLGEWLDTQHREPRRLNQFPQTGKNTRTSEFSHWEEAAPGADNGLLKMG